MKKVVLLVTALLCFSMYSMATARFTADTVKKDTAKINKKIRSLQADLADYQADLTKTQNQIPTDSAALVKATSKTEDALADSKKAASNAVGGDVSDAKKAEKKARQAANASDDANDAKKRLESDRKKVKKLTEKIDKTNKKIAELQGGQ